MKPVSKKVVEKRDSSYDKESGDGSRDSSSDSDDRKI